MSRRKAAPKRQILADPLFKSEIIAKFINSIMRDGKKAIAEKIVYESLSILVSGKNKSRGDDDEGGEGGEGGEGIQLLRKSNRNKELALELFKEVLESVTPSVEVKSRRVGGSTYQVPVEIRGSRRSALAMRWLVEFACQRNEKTMAIRLAHEMSDALQQRGGAYKKREDVHRMAKANQAFAHYRW